MGFLDKMLNRKAGELKAASSKLQNRDLLEAVIGGCMLLAAADGTISDEEIKAVDTLLRTNKNFAHFGSEISDLVNRFGERLKAGYRAGRMDILREIDDIKGSQQEKEDVLINMIEIAYADGEVGEKEQKELDVVAQRLGLRVQDYV